MQSLRRCLSVSQGLLVLGLTWGLPLIALSKAAEAEPFAYVTSDHAASIFDAATNTVVATVPFNDRQLGVVAAPDGRRFYVASGNAVFVVNAITNAVATSIAVGTHPTDLAVSPDGKRVYVTNYDSQNMSVIDTGTNTVAATIAVGPLPQPVAVAPDGKHVYVGVRGVNTVSVIDAATNTVVANIEFCVAGQCNPEGLVVSPDGKYVYVASYEGLLWVIDTAINAVVATVGVGILPYGVAVAPDGKHVYVTNASSNTLSVIDASAPWPSSASSRQIVRPVISIGVGFSPQGVAVTPDGKYVYVVNSASGNVSVVDAAGSFVAATIPVGSRPYAVAFTSLAQRAISGAIGSDGSIRSGWMAGFSVQRQSMGQYLITFLPSFAAAPAIVASQTLHPGNVSFSSVDPSSAVALTTDPAGNNADRGFSFTATGIK